MNDSHFITTLDQLTDLYGEPNERSAKKEIDHLDAHCRALIDASPFMLLATCGKNSADCSPRGDPPGFVKVLDDHTLLIPDRKGNNRVDSLKNIIENPLVGLLFMIPGVNETLRVNGRARISVDTDLCASMPIQGKIPTSVLIVTVIEAFIQCSRALVRSDLWNPDGYVPRDSLPSTGTILADHTGLNLNIAAYDTNLEATVRQTLYGRDDG
jgi:PPOX class probable FMN-dependent enzyme